MQFKNARLFTRDFRFQQGSFCVENGKFSHVLAQTEMSPDAIDLQGAYVIPGLIDVHNHGNSNADFSDGDYAGLVKMAGYLAQNGITSFAPASMTLPYETLAAAFATAKRLTLEVPAGCAVLRGIQMEGPFFSEKKKGAQNGAYLKAPDFTAFEKLQADCGGLIRIVDLAAELPGAVAFTQQAKELCTVSIAHSDSDYEHALAVFQAGARHLTHLYNAMPPIHHRKPGVIGAASECAWVQAEIICDGIHVHPSAIRMAFRLFPDRMILISDALRCCGMPDGEYELGGQPVFLRGKTCTLADGTLAGSVTNLYDCLRNTIAYGIAPEAAIRAATWNPACAIGAEHQVGAIADGMRADFIVCGQDWARQAVYLAGERL